MTAGKDRSGCGRVNKLNKRESKAHTEPGSHRTGARTEPGLTQNQPHTDVTDVYTANQSRGKYECCPVWKVERAGGHSQATRTTKAGEQRQIRALEMNECGTPGPLRRPTSTRSSEACE